MNYVPKCTVGQLAEGQHRDVSSRGQRRDTVPPAKTADCLCAVQLALQRQQTAVKSLFEQSLLANTHTACYKVVTSSV